MKNDTKIDTKKAAPPYCLEELAKLADKPALEKVPNDIAEKLAATTVYISDPEGAFDYRKHLKPPEGKEKAWSLTLPNNSARLGLQGLTGERLERARTKVAKGVLTEPFRPAWADHTFQPRTTSQVTQHCTMRRKNGRVVEPYYGVYGPDDRQVYWPSSYPWRCIGRIFTWKTWGTPGWTWSGSGVLVGPRHVLTAGHVAPWGSNSWGMRFVPGYWDGASVNGAGASSWVSDFRGWNTNNQVAAHDMCVLRLYDPVGSWLGWMGSKTYNDSWEGGNYWTLAGYPGAVAGANRPSAQWGIPVLDDDEDGDAMELEHHGDATAGDSGGPFFGNWSDGPYVVGTVSGGERINGFLGIGSEDNNINAGGNAMVDLIRWAHTNWP